MSLYSLTACASAAARLITNAFWRGRVGACLLPPAIATGVEVGGRAVRRQLNALDSPLDSGKPSSEVETDPMNLKC